MRWMDDLRSPEGWALEKSCSSSSEIEFKCSLPKEDECSLCEIPNKFERLFAHIICERGFAFLKRGWPDFVVFRRWRSFKHATFVELKDKGDALRPEQVVMHKILKRCGFKVLVARPENLGTVLRKLEKA